MSGGSRVYDPSKLHLKKELTQIRKAARVLRDPGTSSSWKSHLTSTRSVPISSAFNNDAIFLNQRSNYHLSEFANKDRLSPSNAHHPSTSQQLHRAEDGDISNGRRDKEKEKEKRVFLYNWRSNKSSSEKSLARLDDLDGCRNLNNDGSSILGSAASASGNSCDDSLSDVRNGGGGDSKSDTYICEHDHDCRYGSRYSALFKCRDTRLGSLASPTVIRRAMGKKKSRRAGSSSSVILKQQQHHKQKQKQKILQQIVLDRNSMNSKRAVLKGIPSSSLVLSQDDSVSLIDQSDETEEYYNSEDFRQTSAASPLLSRLWHQNLTQSSAKLLRGSRRGESSYSQSTPALSTSSYNRHVDHRNGSMIGSWDGTTASSFDVDGNMDDLLDLPGRQGCGIPCYWSKRTPKHRGACGSCCSPSLSDTWRRKGSRLLCGSQKFYHKHHRSLSYSNKLIGSSNTAQGHLPLLKNTGDAGGSSLGTGDSDDEISTNFGELDLEGLSRLDGRRWSSSCRSQDGLEIMAFAGEGEGESMSENNRSLSQRYRPIFFDELIGQNIVGQSLMNAVTKGRIAPVYLFHGPRGTGKTSASKIFANALNCLATGGSKPCGICQECTDFITGKSRVMIEFDGANKKEIERVRYLLKILSRAPSSAFPRYKVFVIDECHLLPSKAWLAFLKFLEEPLPRVVFILITTDPENVPRTVLSRCQKYLFNRIKDGDIVSRLQKISAEEKLDVELDALELIAQNADGSLRDAETMLDQLSLLGKTITTALVNELVGVVSDEKLLELLELAMTSNTAETIKRARELMDSGVDPLVVMSQLASLIMDIIAGTYRLNDAKCSNSLSGGRSLTEAELEKLKHALKLLSEADKQLRVSSERSTWFTATLLQLGSATSPEFTLSGSSRRQSSKTTEEDPSTGSRDAAGHLLKSDPEFVPYGSTSASLSKEGKPNFTHLGDRFLLMDGASSNSKTIPSESVNSADTTASHDDLVDGNMTVRCTDLDMLDGLWLQCIKRCHSKTLRQLLNQHAKLVSISEVDGVLSAYIAFQDKIIKSRAERFIISITNSIEMVLRRNVEVRIILLPDGITSNIAEPIGAPHLLGQKQIVPSAAILTQANMTSRNIMDADFDSHHEPHKASGRSFNDCEDELNGMVDERSSVLSAERNAEINSVQERRREIPMQRMESIIREQRLETAWLQAAEKGTPLSASRLRPEKNQVLPQDGISCQNQLEYMSSMDSHCQDDALNHEIKILKVDRKAIQRDLNGKRVDRHPMSPSLLHQSGITGNLTKDYQGYESGPGASGCSMLLCWNTRPPRRGKVKQGTPVQPQKGGRFLCFGECRKPRHREDLRNN